MSLSAKEIAALSPGERRAHVAALRDELRQVRDEITRHKKEAAAKRRDIATRCTAAKAVARRRKQEIRDNYLREVDAWERQEKAQVHQICTVELQQLRAQVGDAIARHKKQQDLLKRKKRQIAEITGEAHKRRKYAARRKEREGEAIDFVANDLDAEIPGLGDYFRAHAATRFAASKVPRRMSRMEYVLQYVHDNPEALIEFREAETEKRLDELERREAELRGAVKKAGKVKPKAKPKAKKKPAKRRKKATADDVPFLVHVGQLAQHVTGRDHRGRLAEVQESPA